MSEQGYDENGPQFVNIDNKMVQKLLSGNFEEADEAVSLFFGYMVACGFHPGSVTRAMRGFLDSCDE